MEHRDCDTCVEHSGMEQALKSLDDTCKRIEAKLDRVAEISFGKALATGFGIGVPIAGAITGVLVWIVKT